MGSKSKDIQSDRASVRACLGKLSLKDLIDEQVAAVPDTERELTQETVLRVVNMLKDIEASRGDLGIARACSISVSKVKLIKIMVQERIRELEDF